MRLPMLVSVPHAGLRVPEEATPYCRLSHEEIVADGGEVCAGGGLEARGTHEEAYLLLGFLLLSLGLLTAPLFVGFLELLLELFGLFEFLRLFFEVFEILFLAFVELVLLRSVGGGEFVSACPIEGGGREGCCR